MKNTVYLSLPIMLLLLVLQVAILPRFPIAGQVPQLCFLAAVAWGLLRGPEEGAVWAFVAGLLLDLYSSSPAGATSLAMIAAVLVVTVVRRGFPTSHFFAPVLLSALATLVYLVVYLLLLRLLGVMVTVTTLQRLLPMVVLNTFLILPVYWPLWRLERFLAPRRVEMM
ncbi:MAG: rod shape-determining protein MreD [Ardenticatenaceae bacterium]|nr:rod shape-determining protein MreD [Anaerolineales bacterium]MCB8917579.1 rod shape-determining protein MreD [Ardenticatenaceae bacterium]